MSLAMINENMVNPSMITAFGSISPAATNHTQPSAFERLTGFMDALLNRFVMAQPLPAPSVMPPQVETDLPGTLFVNMMEKALIGSLVSLWLLAAWVIQNIIREMFF
ncbi:MAG: hypothetical protein H7839_07065 [Magnetococcus sp. YQC-5]